MSVEGICDWKKCKKFATIGYLKKELCQDCFEKLCDAQNSGKEDWAYAKIGLSPRRNKTTSLEPVPETELDQDSEIKISQRGEQDAPKVEIKTRKRRKKRI